MPIFFHTFTATAPRVKTVVERSGWCGPSSPACRKPLKGKGVVAKRKRRRIFRPYLVRDGRLVPKRGEIVDSRTLIDSSSKLSRGAPPPVNRGSLTSAWTCASNLATCAEIRLVIERRRVGSADQQRRNRHVKRDVGQQPHPYPLPFNANETKTKRSRKLRFWFAPSLRPGQRPLYQRPLVARSGRSEGCPPPCCPILISRRAALDHSMASALRSPPLRWEHGRAWAAAPTGVRLSDGTLTIDFDAMMQSRVSHGGKAITPMAAAEALFLADHRAVDRFLLLDHRENAVAGPHGPGSPASAAGHRRRGREQQLAITFFDRYPGFALYEMGYRQHWHRAAGDRRLARRDSRSARCIPMAPEFLAAPPILRSAGLGAEGRARLRTASLQGDERLRFAWWRRRVAVVLQPRRRPCGRPCRDGSAAGLAPQPAAQPDGTRLGLRGRADAAGPTGATVTHCPLPSLDGAHR